MKHIKIAFIGGDLRQISAARYFAGKGAEVNVWGFDGCRLPEKVQGKDTLQSACEGARAIILPLPYGKEGGAELSAYGTAAEFSRTFTCGKSGDDNYGRKTRL